MKRSRNSLSKFRSAAALTSGSMNTLGAAMLGGPVLAAGAMVVALGRAAFAYENFNQGMQRSLAIMGDVSSAMRDKMSEAAIKMARVSIFSAREVADSFFFLASAGLSAEQSLVALPAVMKFAQAGMFNMARATELLTDAVSALGLKSKDPIKQLKAMVDVGDLLVKANTLADATTEQFAQALVTKAAAASKFFNIPMAETVGVLAAFAERGVKAQDAGVAFNIVLRDMTTKAIKNADEFKRLGVVVFDAAGEFRGIANVIEDLEQSLKGMSDIAAKAALIQLGFSDKSVVFTQNLLGASAAIKEFTEELEKAGGKMEEVQKKQLTEFAAAWENLKGVIIGASGRLEAGTLLIASAMDRLSESIDNLDEDKFIRIFEIIQELARGLVSGGSSFVVQEVVKDSEAIAALSKTLEENSKKQIAREKILAETLAKKTKIEEAFQKILDKRKPSPMRQRAIELEDERGLKAQRLFIAAMKKVNEELRDFGKSDATLKIEAMRRAFGDLSDPKEQVQFGNFIFKVRELERATLDLDKANRKLASQQQAQDRRSARRESLFQRTRTASELAAQQLQALFDIFAAGPVKGGLDTFQRRVNQIQDVLARSFTQADATRGRAFDIGRTRIGGPSERMIQRVNDPQLLDTNTLLQKILDNIGIGN